MNNKILHCVFFLSFFSCSLLSSSQQSKEINQFFEQSFEEDLANSPQFQSYIGLSTNNHLLDDISESFLKKEYERSKEKIRKLKEFDYENLSTADQLSYKIFEQDELRKQQRYEYRVYQFLVNQMGGLQSNFPAFMINFHKVKNIDDAKAYISRLKHSQKKFSQLMEGLKLREKKGILAPQFVYRQVIDQSQNVIKGYPFTNSKKKSPLWNDFIKKVNKLSLKDSQQKKMLFKKAKSALRNEVKRSYKNLISYLKRIVKVAPKEGGLYSYEGGLDYYKFQLNYYTTTSMTADKIHLLGLQDVKRIHKGMKLIMKKVGFKSQNLKDFFHFMKTSKKFKYPNNNRGRKQYITDTKKIIQNMNQNLPKVFTRFPKANVIVKPVEPFREKTAGMAFYYGPSEFGNRPGTYYINLYQMNSVAKHEMEALAYHEAVPGHHMQIALALELKDIPRFRKYSYYGAYSEGWGLYSEFLPKEMGHYEDPYSDFGRLSMELWRALRLVVDTGLHAKGWTRQMTINYLLKNAPQTKLEITKAVERYIVMPGQATSYKIGMMKILELRKKAKDILKEKFDIRYFHDEVLKTGEVPLNLLEEKIIEWAKNFKSRI